MDLFNKDSLIALAIGLGVGIVLSSKLKLNEKMANIPIIGGLLA